MARYLKVTLSDGAQQTIAVPERYMIPDLEDAQWLQVTTLQGGQFLVPTRLITALALSAKGAK